MVFLRKQVIWKKIALVGFCVICRGIKFSFISPMSVVCFELVRKGLPRCFFGLQLFQLPIECAVIVDIFSPVKNTHVSNYGNKIIRTSICSKKFY